MTIIIFDFVFKIRCFFFFKYFFYNYTLDPPKKRRVETILENYINDIRQEREITKVERNEEIQRREQCKEERRIERARMHEEKMKIQRSLIDVLNTLAKK